jgi:hypothetical protein
MKGASRSNTTRQDFALCVVGRTNKQRARLDSKSWRACSVFYSGMSQTSEARQLIRAQERDPEVETIATGAKRESVSACWKRVERSQI